MPVLVTASVLVKMVILIRMMLAVTVLWILTYGEESVMTGSVVLVKMSMRQPPRGHFFEFARKPSQARSGRDSRAQAEGSIKNGSLPRLNEAERVQSCVPLEAGTTG